MPDEQQLIEQIVLEPQHDFPVPLGFCQEVILMSQAAQDHILRAVARLCEVTRTRTAKRLSAGAARNRAFVEHIRPGKTLTRQPRPQETLPGGVAVEEMEGGQARSISPGAEMVKNRQGATGSTGSSRSNLSNVSNQLNLSNLEMRAD